jgi:bifunctional enzyme CysN/CysC
MHTDVLVKENGEQTGSAPSSLLRFLTCGSVDDGKSTLIGRLLIEAGAVYQDQLESLQAESAKHGTAAGEIDPALLVDGLEDERQQGITIDVAYRYFATPRRKFIIADTPGHEQFTRNMATGASTAELAILLVDASKGILTQTKRHAFLVSLLGIQHAVVAVNKMDLVNYSEAVFQQIRRDFQQFAENLDLPDIHVIPLSALKGENISRPSRQMSWYTGEPLLGLLEKIPVSTDRNPDEFRFPVQWVNRPDASFRGFSGTVASGKVQVGDEVMVLPSRKRSRVVRVVNRGSDADAAACGKATTLVLQDEIDVTRGDLLVHPDKLPRVSRDAEAMLVWMSENGLVPGKSYWCKHTTKRLSAQVESIRYMVDVNNLRPIQASSLKLNQIGRCRVRLSEACFYDEYVRNRRTGSFILVDRVTNETVAAGMFTGPDEHSTGHWGNFGGEVRRAAYQSLIGAEQRAAGYGHQPLTILITGLSGSGKTSLAQHLEQKIFAIGCICLVLDGGDLRSGINRDLGYTAEERSENLRRAAELARLANRAGQICIAAFVAPNADVRTRVKELVGPEQTFHVHLATPLSICQGRDQTGQYEAAARGEISNFPGVSAAYEQPQDADLVLSADAESPEQLADAVWAALGQRGLLPAQ